MMYALNNPYNNVPLEFIRPHVTPVYRRLDQQFRRIRVVKTRATSWRTDTLITTSARRNIVKDVRHSKLRGAQEADEPKRK
jgi:hypothetical protein